jgi:hypothetical protein
MEIAPPTLMTTEPNLKLLSTMQTTLFPIKYYQAHVYNHSETFGRLLESAKHLLRDTDGRWNCNVQTTHFEESDVIDPQELVDFLYPYLFQYFPRNVNIEVVNSWLNVYNNGCSQEPHNHVNFPDFINFSGVIFVRFDETKDGKFYFENMNLDHTILGYTHIFEQPHIVEPDVKEGDLLLFPAFVRHGVRMQNNDTNRMTLSFNLAVTPAEVDQ